MAAVIIPAHQHQGTDEWLEWRRSRGGASEVAALMGCAPWFPRTPYELWLVKTGRAEVPENDAMRFGSQHEAGARAAAEVAYGAVFEPQTVEKGRIIASLDGITFDGETILEIKVPAAGFKSETWKAVDAEKRVPDHYWWQVQQQLYCSGALEAIFAVFVPTGVHTPEFAHTFVHVLPDAQAHAAIKDAWAQFFEHLDTDTPPPLTDRDVRERTDTAWRDAVAAWKEAKAWLDEASKAEKAARETLIQLAGEQSSRGAGVKATRYFVAGNTDYKRAAEDAGADLSKYQKPGRWQWRLTESE